MNPATKAKLAEAPGGNPLHFKTSRRESKYHRRYENSLSHWSVPYTSFYVATSYGQTHVLTCGPEDGKPLVLLHAMGFSSTIWLPNIEQLAQQHRVYAIDYMGDLNKSAPSSLPETRTQHAEWLDEALDELNIETCELGGISYGGFLAMNYAIHFPSRVEKLFLLSPAASFTPLHDQFIYRIIAMSFFPIKWHIALFIRWLSKHRLPKALIDQFHAAYRYGTVSLKVPPSVYSDEELGKLTMPVLLLVGNQEVISDVSFAYKRAQACCPSLQAEMLDGVGHLLNLENPHYVNKRVAEFLGVKPL